MVCSSDQFAIKASDLTVTVLKTRMEPAQILRAMTLPDGQPQGDRQTSRHLVAELNHVVHGKKSESSEDDRQLASKP